MKAVIKMAQGMMGWPLRETHKQNSSSVASQPTPPNVPLLRALWSLLDGIWGLLKGSWGVLEIEQVMFCVV